MTKRKKPSQQEHKRFKQTAIKAFYLSKPTHLQTREDRYEAGRALREKCPRDAHAEFTVDRDGRQDPIDLLLQSTQGLSESLLPIRFDRMLASPFTFLRGSAATMAADLSVTPSTGYAVQSGGDCHLVNFGGFATPERNVIFDIRDFDETFPAPWEWDLKRLAASFVIASRDNGHKLSDGIAAATRMVQSYRDKLQDLAEQKTLKAWYARLDYEELIDLMCDMELQKRRKKNLGKALRRDACAELVKLAHFPGGKPKIKDQPPLIFHEANSQSAEYRERILNSFELYRQSLSEETRVVFDRYELVDTAIKVVGVGSVGTICGVSLFFAAENDSLFLQIKEARQSVLQPYSKMKISESNGARVVIGQRIMQAASDIFLGHFVNRAGRQFYVRQLRDVKVKPLVDMFSPQAMIGFAQECGWALAHAHARSGDPAIIAGYIGKGNTFPKAIGRFAHAYAGQIDADHLRLTEAVDNGVIQAYSEGNVNRTRRLSA